ncbi:MAG: RdgB/HAM1 family non-canonical purine NTP pyrophosphatase [Atribacterota bacterium]
MLKLVLATRNSGKLKEIKYKLKKYPVIVESLNDYPEIPEIEETGKTFAENALIKAKTVVKWTKLPALADDSGLEIDYIGKKPGIYSSRWGSTDQERIKKVLDILQNTKSEQRGANFICVMSLVLPEQRDYTTRGVCSGRITLSPKGSKGFGYDPIFIPDGYDQTFAELGVDVKNKISHRAVALEKMIKFIVDHFKLK